MTPAAGSLRHSARVTMVLLAVSGLTSASSLLTFGVWLVGGDGDAVSAWAISDPLYDLATTLGAAEMGLLWITGVAFVIWFHRAYANLRSLGHEPRYGTGWAVGGWLVPILSWVRPYQIAHEIWQHSRTGDARDTLGVMRLWWGTWVASGVIGTCSSVLPVGLESRATLWSTVATEALTAVAAVAGLETVRRLSRLQAERFDASKPAEF